jgi:hypothetical protein
MAFSVSNSRPFRSLGFGKSSGKHAAPKGRVPAQRQSVESTTNSTNYVHRPAHAATMPRLTGPQASSAEKNHAA